MYINSAKQWRKGNLEISGNRSTAQPYGTEI